MTKTDNLTILHLTPWMTQGGAERAIVEIIEHVPAKHHLAIMHPTTSDMPFFYWDQIQVPIWHLNASNTKWGYPKLASSYTTLLWTLKPDIVHAHQWAAMNVARFFRRFTNSRVITTAQNSMFASGRQKREQQLAHYSDATTAVSIAIVEEYQSLGIQAQFIPNGFDPHKFSVGNQAQARQKLGLPLDRKIALLAGRIAPQKNHLMLAEALHQIPTDVLVLCVGNASDQAYYNTFQQKIAEYRLQQKIIMIPATPNIIDYYHASDVLLLPSQYEGLPLVILEAAACGVPTLATHEANAANIINDNVTGWLCQKTPTAFGERLNVVLDSNTDRATIGMAARAKVLDTYAMPKIAAQYAQLYQDITR